MGVGQKFLNILEERTLKFGAQYRLFGLFTAINYPISFLILYFVGGQFNESLVARLIAVLLAIPLIFAQRWPTRLKNYLNLYWYFTVLYCLPCLATYMMLKNHMSTEWLMNGVLGLFLLVLLVDWLMFILLLLLGILAGCILFVFIENGPILYHQNTSPFFITFYIYGYAILIGVLFARNKEKIDYERFYTIKMFAGALAHEMRTPLLGISLKAARLKTALPILTEAYKDSLKDSREGQVFKEEDLSLINQTPEEIQKTARQAFGFIDTTLLNLKEDFKDSPKTLCSIKTCIEEALKDYNLSDREKSFIQLNLENDFEFRGNPSLMKHVLFNLLKNSIYYVKAANKGEIIIKTYQEHGINILSFKDTGAGIAPNILPRIFDKFYSRTKYGTGIGLAFCKAVMKGLEGDIICRSQQGEYTEFILTFPPLENN